MLKSGDRIRESSTTVGTASFILLGPGSGFQAFGAVCTDGDCIYYCAVCGTQWEVGLGTWRTGGTLERTAILASSESGGKVYFGLGTKDIFCTAPAGGPPSYVSDLQGVAQDETVDQTMVLLRRIVKLLEPLGVVDASTRQRVAVEVLPTLANLTTLGTITNAVPVGNVATLAGLDHKPFIIDQARIAYNGLRSQLNL